MTPIEQAAKRRRKHLEVVGERDESEMFGYELVRSPYYDPSWGNTNGMRIDCDLQILADFAVACLARTPAEPDKQTQWWKEHAEALDKNWAAMMDGAVNAFRDALGMPDACIPEMIAKIAALLPASAGDDGEADCANKARRFKRMAWSPNHASPSRRSDNENQQAEKHF